MSENSQGLIRNDTIRLALNAAAYPTVRRTAAVRGLFTFGSDDMSGFMTFKGGDVQTVSYQREFLDESDVALRSIHTIARTTEGAYVSTKQNIPLFAYMGEPLDDSTHPGITFEQAPATRDDLIQAIHLLKEVEAGGGAHKALFNESKFRASKISAHLMDHYIGPTGRRVKRTARILRATAWWCMMGLSKSPLAGFVPPAHIQGSDTQQRTD